MNKKENMKTQYTIDTIGNVSGGDNCIGQTQEVYNPLGFGNPIYDPNDPNGPVRYNTTMTLPCQDRCSWLYSLIDSQYNDIEYYGKETIKDMDLKAIYSCDELKLNVIVKKDFLDCYTYSNVKSDNCNISIYNILGQSLLQSRYNLYKGMNNYRINIDDFNSGLYLIQINVDGIIQKTEKFIIVK
jgi:hypothetical protein